VSTLIRSILVTLRPATLADRRAVYEWMACSDLTASMMGPTDFAENPIPTWEQFCDDYRPHFFDGSKPQAGRSFIMERNGEPVGHISYDRSTLRASFAELDLWMRDSRCCGKGFGSDALRSLSDHLHTAFGIREMILRPSARNTRAIRSYEKAGFTRVAISNAEQADLYEPGEYHDTVVMRRTFP